MRADEFTQPQSAGCFIVAADTGRWCLQKRSTTVTDPGVWSTWGGGREPDETLEQCVRRELAEESGYKGPCELIPMELTPQYATFIAQVPHEFEPQANAEWQDYCWVDIGDWPAPLHPGAAAALKNIPTAKNLDEKINQDIAAQGWRAEKTITVPDIGELHLRARNTSHITPPQFIVDVATPDGKNIGYFRFLVMDWEAPKTGWFATKSKKDPYVIGGNVSVWDQYQKKGIARQVYQWIKNLGNDVRPSTTQTAAGKAMWRGFARDPLEENFADGKVKGKSRPGRVRRAGASCNGSVTDLRARAKKASGERARMYHWCANMKSGRNKNK
jgi:8-oxo-dGTP pyrophosphatase MutT (NUDIX family)/GNAT superfamily N-acetyltransferase